MKLFKFNCLLCAVLLRGTSKAGRLSRIRLPNSLLIARIAASLEPNLIRKTVSVICSNYWACLDVLYITNRLRKFESVRALVQNLKLNKLNRWNLLSDSNGPLDLFLLQRYDMNTDVSALGYFPPSWAEKRGFSLTRQN